MNWYVQLYSFGIVSCSEIYLMCVLLMNTSILQEIAVSLLCQRTKKADGTKRRRIDETSGPVESIDQVKPLQPLLLCLECALKADAHEGGEWTRGDDNQRYNMVSFLFTCTWHVCLYETIIWLKRRLLYRF